MPPTRLVLAFFLLLIATTATADRVTPKATSTSGVVVRELPTRQSARVDSVALGESLRHVGSVPYWYEVQLEDGSPGYMSKTASEIVKDDDASEAVSAAAGGATFVLHAIDVGTGLAVLVEGADFFVLYDGGSNDDRRRGKNNRLTNYLALAVPNLTRIDHVILSHPHRDHVELLADVFAKYDIDNVWDSGAINNTAGYRRFVEAVSNEPDVVYHAAARGAGTFTVTVNNQPYEIAHGARIDTGENITLGDGATMRFLHADGGQHASFNENSLVVMMNLGEVEVLFMGDAEAGARAGWADGNPEPTSVEAALLACCTTEINADVLIVGHHGSRTSSRTDFLDAVSADVFVVSTGPTQYGSVTLPDQIVIDELQNRGEVWRTDVDDDACGQENEKVGPDADGRPGGCTNVRLVLGPGESVDGSIWVGDEE